MRTALRYYYYHSSGGDTPANAVMYEDSTAARYEDDEFVLYE